MTHLCQTYKPEHCSQPVSTEFKIFVIEKKRDAINSSVAYCCTAILCFLTFPHLTFFSNLLILKSQRLKVKEILFCIYGLSSQSYIGDNC